MYAVHIVGLDGAPRLRDEVPDVLRAVVNVGRVDGKDAPVSTSLRDPSHHRWGDDLPHLPLQSGDLRKGHVAGEEIQRPALLDPVFFRVAVQPLDRVDRLLVAEEREGRDEGASADAGHSVERRLRHGSGRYPGPALEETGAERTPVAAAGDDEYVDLRRCRHSAGTVRVVLRLRARQQVLKHLAAVLHYTLVRGL